MNIDVNQNVYSNNCSLLYFGRFYAENKVYVSIHHFKTSFSKMMCRALWNITSYKSFHSALLSEIDSMHSTEESKNKVSSAMENFSKMNEEKFGLRVSAVFCGGTWTLLEQ